MRKLLALPVVALLALPFTVGAGGLEHEERMESDIGYGTEEEFQEEAYQDDTFLEEDDLSREEMEDRSLEESSRTERSRDAINTVPEYNDIEE